MSFRRSQAKGGEVSQRFLLVCSPQSLPGGGFKYVLFSPLYLKVKIDGTDTKRWVSLVKGPNNPICRDCAMYFQLLYLRK